ncbi:hypothetical protein RB195_006726 [Necator americanus]|uniref:Kunitz/Bovine pancreatic trypsin inhibitor domain protein n=1 Tax=Necator americanus TaxID=51031 RepID=A0ABR1BXM3_NECAM
MAFVFNLTPECGGEPSAKVLYGGPRDKCCSIKHSGCNTGFKWMLHPRNKCSSSPLDNGFGGAFDTERSRKMAEEQMPNVKFGGLQKRRQQCDNGTSAGSIPR